MSILALGLNHKTAPVDMRERLTFGPDIVVGALRSLLEHPSVAEGVILSTCNRTEVYCASSGIGEAPVKQWLCQFHGLAPETVAPYLYTYRDQEAVRHLLRVSSGLDSMVLGEPQILGQVKTAFQTANQAGTAQKLLPLVPAYLLGGQTGAYRHGDRLKPGVGGLRRRESGAADLQ